MFSNKHHGSLSKKITSPLDFPLSNKEKENRSIQDTLFELLFSSETHKHQNVRISIFKTKNYKIKFLFYLSEFS